jgi:hypothetical protein
MDKTVLVDKEIEDGKLLIQALDKTSLPVEGAIWYYYVDSDEWRLLIVSTFVDKEGPEKAYTLIQSTLKQFESSFSLSLSKISILSPTNRLIKLIRMAIRTGHGISGIRFSRNTINNIYIEDAYIYRI